MDSTARMATGTVRSLRIRIVFAVLILAPLVIAFTTRSQGYPWSSSLTTGTPSLRLLPEAFTVVLPALAFLVKPFYMLMAAWMCWKVRKVAELALTKRALICFLVGETFCAINMLAFEDRSLLLEYGHVLGMVAALSCLFFWLISMFVPINDGEHSCILKGLCSPCHTATNRCCWLRSRFPLFCLLLLSVVLLPLSAPVHPVAYSTLCLGRCIPWEHGAALQILEWRLLPAASAVLLLLAAITARKHFVEAILYAAVALGALSFSLLRLGLFSIFQECLWWSGFWEECSELILIAGIGVVLASLRPGLFRPDHHKKVST